MDGLNLVVFLIAQPEKPPKTPPESPSGGPTAEPMANES